MILTSKSRLLESFAELEADFKAVTSPTYHNRYNRPPFGEQWMKRYLPSYVRAAPSQLHRDIAADLRDLHLIRGQRINRIGPRDSGKTVWGTTGYITYCALEGIEPYTMILSAGGKLANGFLRDIRGEVEKNATIALDYPDSAGIGPVWRADTIQLRNGCMIGTGSPGSGIRGSKNKAARPTLIVGDDLNEDGDAYSPTERRRKLDWFTRAIMNLGGPETNVLVYGTAIHRQAICYELYRGELAPAWNTKSYRSIISWPDRMDLWGEWEGLLANLADANRLETARKFYDANRVHMDKGAEVLWPERANLYSLMLHRVAVGRAAFDSDKQDRPGTDGATEWPAEWFDWPDRWFQHFPENLQCRLQTLDPSKGIVDRPGDYQAHIYGGMDVNGTIWLDADARREPITECVDRAIDLAVRFKSEEVVAEGNNTMGLLMPAFMQALAQRREKNKPGVVNYREVNHTEPKLARLRRGGKFLGTRHPVYGPMVRVRNTPGGRMLMDQWRDVPNGEYDDLPDAVGTFVGRIEAIMG